MGQALLDDRQFARALALLTDAVREFPDPREPGVAAMHGQLARAHMFVSDFPSALAVAEPTLAAAEELDLSAVLADTLITKGSALGTMGRPFEAMALESAARDVAQRLNLAWLELRAITNIGLLMASDDPVAGVQLMKEGMALAERVGVRNDVLTANGIEFALPTGEWEWARATLAEHLATDVGGLRPAPPDDLGRDAACACRHRMNSAELARLDELSVDDEENVQYVQQLRVYIALMDNGLAEARRMAEELATIDPINAAVLLVVAGHAAAWERDAEAAHRIETSLRQAPSRGRYVDALRRAMHCRRRRARGAPARVPRWLPPSGARVRGARASWSTAR